MYYTNAAYGQPGPKTKPWPTERQQVDKKTESKKIQEDWIQWPNPLSEHCQIIHK